jgi:hypothetical protein
VIIHQQNVKCRVQNVSCNHTDSNIQLLTSQSHNCHKWKNLIKNDLGAQSQQQRLLSSERRRRRKEINIKNVCTNLNYTIYFVANLSLSISTNQLDKNRD